jgi:hypothetical protein
MKIVYFVLLSMVVLVFSAQAEMTSVYSGRYVYITDGDFLLDTETGRVWHLVSHGDDYNLLPVPYKDLTGKKVGVCPQPQDTTLSKGH